MKNIPMRKPRIYIAGPYSKGDVAINVKNAIDLAEELVKSDFAPYIPHLTHFWHMLHPHEYEFWLDYDNEYLLYCDALIRLKGESSGADREIETAEKNNIPVFHDVNLLIKHFEK